MSFAAVILAAGRSSRMGDFKPLLPLGDSTFAGQLADLFRSAGAEALLFVTGREADCLEKAMNGPSVFFRRNAEYASTDMFASVKIGLNGILEESGAEAVFVGPVDDPLITPFTVHALLDALDGHPDKDFFLPVYRGKTGHPVLIRRNEIPALLKWDGNGGLKGYLNQRSSAVHLADVPDPAIRMDADDHDAYDALREYGEKRAIPSPERCRELWAYFQVPQKVRDHCRAVAEESMAMGEALLAKGYSLNMAKLEAAALLHDLARVHPHHPDVAAKWLTDLGHTGIAECVRVHMALTQKYAHICEELVVFLADKYRRGTQKISIEDRYREKIRQFTDESAVKAAETRLAEALAFEQIYREAVE